MAHKLTISDKHRRRKPATAQSGEGLHKGEGSKGSYQVIAQTGQTMGCGHGDDKAEDVINKGVESLGYSHRGWNCM
jgi:hypothetical protein